jgi:hypothetical protein
MSTRATPLNAIDRISVTVVAASSFPCSVPSLRPIDQSTQAVLLSNLTPGCSVEVWAGDSSGLAPVGVSLPGASVSRVPLPRRLDPGTVVRVLQASGTVTTTFTDPLIVENNYVTNRYDNERSGWNPNETTLTVDRARGLAKICEHMVDGPIRAQPLFVQDVDIPGKGKHNLVFIATDADSVWAFDADSCVPNDKGLWVDTAGNPSPRNLADSASGERAVTAADLTSAWPAGSDPGCAIMLGITATPAVDRTTNTLYVLGLLIKNNKLIYRLHALDITTGHDQPGSPVEISDATVQFRGLSFNAALQGARPGLLLDKGVAYIGFGSHCEIGNYHGWVLAYDADIPGSPGFLGQLGVFNTSPADADGAGAWQSGLGLAADGDGTIYLVTGNGNFDPDTGSYADTVLNLRLPTNPTAREMEVVNFFQPADYSTRTTTVDLGSGGAVLLSRPDPGPITAPIVPKRFILAAGQRGFSYLINRDCINCNGNPRSCLATTGRTCNTDDSNLVVQSILELGGVYGGAAYYTGPLGTRIYYAGTFLPIQAFTLQWVPPLVTNNGGITPDRAPAALIPTVSSNRSNPRTGILWAAFADPDTQELMLHAYDADNLDDNLFSLSGQHSVDFLGNPTSWLDIGRWALSWRNPFQVLTVIHGKVYAGSQDRLVVFAPARCYPVQDSSGVVVFLCPRIPAQRILQKKLARKWITVTDPASRVDKDVIYIV